MGWSGENRVGGYVGSQDFGVCRMWSLDYVEVAVDSLGEDLDHVDTLTVETESVQVTESDR